MRHRRTMQKSNQGPSEHNPCLPGTQNVSNVFTSAADGYPRTHPTTVLATPIQCTVLTPQKTSQSDCPSVAKPYRKPNCSYTVLIGMALKASSSGTLPVSQIYKYIEQEFPFFKTGAPDGWKNSIRHSLSLGQYFHKVDRKQGSKGKKGFHWEVAPNKKAALDKEIEHFVKQEGLEMTSTCTATFPETPVTESFPLAQGSTVQDKLSTVQSDLPGAVIQQAYIEGVESIGMADVLRPAASVSNVQVSQSSLNKLLSSLGALDTTCLQNISPSDGENVSVILLKNFPEHVGATTAMIPNPSQNLLTGSSELDNQHDAAEVESIADYFLNPSSSMQSVHSSDILILQSDSDLLKDIYMEPNTDIVSFANTTSASANLFDNCNSAYLIPPQSGTIDNGLGLLTVSTNSMEGCNSVCDVRQLVDLGTLAETGSVQESTIYVDLGQLTSQNLLTDPAHPKANITLAKLNWDPAMPLDPYHSATAAYFSPSLDNVDGIPHSDSFARAIAPVYCDWNCWNDPEYVARQLHQDHSDFGDVLHQVIVVQQNEEKEERKKKRQCMEKAQSTPNGLNTASAYHNQSEHTGGKWIPSLSDLNKENEEEDDKMLNTSIPDTKVIPKSALKRSTRRKVLHEMRRSEG